MINKIVRKLAGQMVFQNGESVTYYRHRLLLMLDEFPSLGKLEIFQESLVFIAGYGIKAYLICQDINQLKSRESGYGHDEAITSNCHIQTAFAPNRIETAEHLSKLAGQTTVIKEQITTSYDAFKAINDLRRAQGKKHQLPTILSLSAAAILCGMRGYKDIALWVQSLGNKARSRFRCRKRNGRYEVPPHSNP